MKKWVFLCWTLLFLTACNEDTIYNEPQLVVEGWIEDGSFPVVILTTTLPISDHYQNFDDIKNHVIKWAKVTVSDGEKEVILTGTYKDRYEPPYIYTTTDLRGKVGKTYKLTVDYKDFHAEAETVIPPVATFDKISIKPTNNGKYKIMATIADPAEEKNYYKIFSRVVPEQGYYLSFYPCIFHDSMPELHNGITILRGERSNDKEREIYFDKDDHVLVKLAQVDEEGYRFWKDYEESCAFARNPMFPLKENIHSNIKGGLGYWCGYGAKEYMVYIDDHYIKQLNKK